MRTPATYRRCALGLLTLVLALTAAPALAADDTTPPVLSSINLSTSGPYAPGSQVGFAWTATDAGGIERVEVHVADSDGALHLFEGSAVDDVRQTITAAGWTLGDAEVDFIKVVDTSDNQSIYTADGVVEYYPSGELSTHSINFAALGFVVGATTTDGAPPVLSEFDFNPKTVDVAAGAKVVTITARVTDATGAVAPTMILSSDAGKEDLGEGPMTRISGDAKNGVYKREVSIPATATIGAWTVRIDPLSDTLGNAETNPHHHATTLTVTRAAETEAPVLSEFAFTPASVDVTAGSKQVTVTARVTDATGAEPPTLVLDSDTSTQTLGGAMTRTSGDAKDGVYSRTVTIPTTAANGAWTVRIDPLADTLGNAETSPHNHATKLTVTSAATDISAPVLSEFAFTPTSVDVSAGSQDVTVTAHVTDATGAVAPTVVLESDTSTQTLDGTMTRTSGDAKDGEYSATVTIPTTAIAGTWTVMIRPLADTIGNTADHVHPTKLTVTGAPVGTAPDAPTGVTAVAGNASAQVSWTAPDDNGSPITSYTVTATPGGKALDVAAGATSGRVTGLANGTAYTFTVTATNEHGTSPASAPSASVRPAAVPGKVATPKVVLKRSKVIITWKAPAANGARITGYRVVLDGDLTRVAADRTRLVVRGLAPGRHKVKVAATNSVGTGPLSRALRFRVPR